jgi:hypothetical protein
MNDHPRALGSLTAADLGKTAICNTRQGRLDRVEHSLAEDGTRLSQVYLWLGNDYWSTGRLPADHPIVAASNDWTEHGDRELVDISALATGTQLYGEHAEQVAIPAQRPGTAPRLGR